MTLAELAKKIRKRCVLAESGCLEWQGAKNEAGYGVMRYKGATRGVHRIMLAAELNNPEMLEPCAPGGFGKRYVLHSCDNPKCCNPEHLRLGTKQDNADDANARSRRPEFIAALPRRLTDEQASEVYTAAQTWDGMCDMMKKYRMSQGSVQDIAAKRTYKHIHGDRKVSGPVSLLMEMLDEGLALNTGRG